MKVRKLFCGKVGKSPKIVKPVNSKTKTVLFTNSWKHPEKIDDWLKSFDKVDEFQEEGFHRSIAPILIIAVVFGIFPVNNLTSKNPISVNFKWKSIRVAYSIFTLTVCGFVTAFALAYVFKTSIMFGKIVFLVYYLSSFLSFIFFVRLALNWNEMMIEWRRVEKTLPKYTEKKQNYQNRLRMRSVAAVILFLSFIEHLLSTVSQIIEVFDCPRIHNVFEAYMVRSFPLIYYFFPYSIPLSVLVKFAHITSTFIWSFTDLFIMLISMGLSSMLKVINERMLQVKGKVRTKR